MAETDGGLVFGTPQGRWVLFATVLGSALALIDGTVVTIALPVIGRELHAGTASLQWTVNGYALTLAAFLLLGGSLGDRVGRRRVFRVGVVWFALASLLCGFAPDIRTLIAARALQGVGGALLTPGSLAIIQASFGPDDRGRAIGAWSGLGGIAGTLAPFIGGWLVQVASWRWVFWVNVPLAVVVAAALRHVPESADADAAPHLDIVGTTLGAVGLAGLTTAFTAWPTHGVSDPAVVVPLVVGAAAVVGFLAVEARTRYPMLPLRLFRWRSFSAVNGATFLVYAALSGVFFFLVVTLQVVCGYSPLAAGVAPLPVTLLLLVLSSRAGGLGTRIGPRLPMTVGPLVCAGSVAVLARLGPHAPYVSAVLPGVVGLGLGLALTVAPLTSVALSAAPDHLAGTASGVNNAVARIAGLLAVAVLPLVAGVGAQLTDASTLAPAHRAAMLICAGLLAAGGLLSLLVLPASMAAVRPPSGTTAP
ncbi:MAG: DHA2 family efflux MFS transporter permease subunit [Cellulomonas sp.]|uniref:DHA2 family efflux MFS transporter permease subunit n=1 Tax=Cellulomonas sp. TaxID=40001 RepID=UPI001852AA3B|nr:DHA2 family efflux MFS transporter permease subunit [Cellulomonas sp.]NMM15573.1 DHA2 family efflux MFS transporter permease subunit [Cellulomonas sp.]NMM29821.1 DHA2 family efflux MFS transporter permease subunit [Cellulomonas sp.]